MEIIDKGEAAEQIPDEHVEFEIEGEAVVVDDPCGSEKAEGEGGFSSGPFYVHVESYACRVELFEGLCGVIIDRLTPDS